MAEAADELSAPLGRDSARGKRHIRLPLTGMQALATVLGLFLATFAGYALFHDDPLGGEPAAQPGQQEVLPARSFPDRGRAGGPGLSRR